MKKTVFVFFNDIKVSTRDKRGASRFIIATLPIHPEDHLYATIQTHIHHIPHLLLVLLLEYLDGL